MLTLEGIWVQYGPIVAVQGLSLEVREGEIVALVGRNGVGKSSTLLAVTGVVRPAAGVITFLNKPITRESPDVIVRLGISLVPEGRRIFSRLSVRENLILATTTCRNRKEAQSRIEGVAERFPILKYHFSMPADKLSGGQQQQLAIARALLCEPKLLLLDEPSLGLSPVMMDAVFDLLCELRDAGTTILVVEQNISQALDIADRAYVLESGGRIAFEGPASELAATRQVETAYLGVGLEEDDQVTAEVASRVEP